MSEELPGIQERVVEIPNERVFLFTTTALNSVQEHRIRYDMRALGTI